ncbi:MAG TPA: 3-carboxy-cis,cis-muconate cycloisomerase [Burkholderiaceae bacterium]|nr:3-carboxy-cis,cis-muconate cycloisomerase [Burkholderiaceae bacterium]
MTVSSLTGRMFSTDAMRNVFSDRAAIQRMLDFEAALARAEAAHGVIPAQAVAAIEAGCEAAHIDFEALTQAAATAGNLAIPLIQQLTAHVAKTDADAAKYVHWGATSQDVIDTGLLLQLRDALTHIDAELALLADALARLASTHRQAPMIGRTWMQHALPTTFGLKAAGWLDALLRHRQRLDELRPRLLALQFGGAAGTLASLGTRGLEVATTLATELDLELADTPWHTQRDRVAEVATVLGLLTGSLGKIARDLSLQTQTEVSEVAEPAAPGRGGSSSMPHKRNPIACAATLAAAVRVPGLVATMLTAMVQEHERALGGWQAEWDTLPEIVQLTAGALQHMRQVTQGLTVDAERMRANLDMTHGLIMAEAVTLALAPKIGRMQAHQLVEQACHSAAASGRQLQEVLAEMPQVGAALPVAEWQRLFDSAAYLGVADEFVERVLRRHDRLKNNRNQE